MKFKALIADDIYWAGFGLFVGFPMFGFLITGEFSPGLFVIWTILYTLIAWVAIPRL